MVLLRAFALTGAVKVFQVIFMGFDMSHYTTFYEQSWVQEFTRKGGGNHSSHIHWNTHVNAFYFLKCGPETSFPIFHDPRPGAEMSRLPQKDATKITLNSSQVHYKPKPGTMIIFPGYVPHQFAVDAGLDPFRFIHFNIQAVRNVIIDGVKNEN